MKIKGSHTVEAALLMAIIIPLLFSVIYLTFYLHDSCFLEGMTLEICAYAAMNSEEEDLSGKLKAYQQEKVSKNLLGVRYIENTISLGKEEITVNYKGTFTMPGMIAKWLGDRFEKISVQRSMKWKTPVKQIHKFRGLENLIS